MARSCYDSKGFSHWPPRVPYSGPQYTPMMYPTQKRQSNRPIRRTYRMIGATVPPLSVWLPTSVRILSAGLRLEYQRTWTSKHVLPGILLQPCPYTQSAGAGCYKLPSPAGLSTRLCIRVMPLHSAATSEQSYPEYSN